MLSPLLAVIGLLRLIDAFKVFDTIFLLTGGGPGTATESPSILAYKLRVRVLEGRRGLGARGAGLDLVLPLLQRLLSRRPHAAERVLERTTGHARATDRAGRPIS